MSSGFTKRIPLIAGLITGLLLAIVSVPLIAQPAEEVHPLAYDKAHEVVLAGNIREVVTKHEPGSPIGMHLLVDAGQGTVDAHLGPYMTKETKDALHQGTPVQIVGAKEKLNGKEYFLARVLTVGGQTIKVRSENGFLVQAHKPNAHPSTRTDKAHMVLNGGAQ
jgi:hypothetical protein